MVGAGFFGFYICAAAGDSVSRFCKVGSALDNPVWLPLPDYVHHRIRLPAIFGLLRLAACAGNTSSWGFHAGCPIIIH